MVCRPLETTLAERMAAEGYTKLIPKRLGPYGILSVGPEYLNILQDCVENIL